MAKRGLTEAPWIVSVLFAVIAIGLAALDWTYYQQESAHFKQGAEDNLSAIARLKADQIAHWREDRLLDAETIRLNPWVARGVADLLRHPPSAPPDPDVVAWLSALRTQYDFASVALFDTAGNARYRVGPGEAHANSVVAAALAQVLRTGKPTLSDLHRQQSTGAPHLSILVPLAARGPGGGRVAGVLSFRVDPHRFLYPLIQTWPGSSETAETMLIRREGDAALYLNDLRHRDDTALSLQVSLSDVGAPAVQAALGREGVIEGIDYRGVLVLAALKRVADSPWSVVAQVAQDEVYGPIRQRSRSLAFQLGALVLAAGLAALFIFERQRAAFLWQQRLDATERDAVVGHFDRLARHANDIILLLDHRGGIVEANERAVEAYGYSHDELLRLGARELQAPGSAPDVDKVLERSEPEGGLRFETLHQRKDGREFPVEISSRVIEVRGALFHQSIIRDVSERKHAEAQIARLNRLYATLSEVNEAIMRTDDRDKLLADVCRKAIEFGAFQVAWISLVDPASENVRPVAASGTALEGLASFELSAGADPQALRPISLAIREDRLVVSTDLQNDPTMPSCNELVPGAGYRAAAAVPLRVGGRVVGVFTLVARDPEAFEARDLRLVEELGADVSFALESLDREQQRRRAGESLRESEARFRRMIETTQEGVLLVDAAARITYANRRMAEMLSCTEGELVGRTLFAFVHETSRAMATRSFERRRHGVKESFDVRFVRKDGRPCWGMVSATPVMSPEGRFEGSFSMVSDITDRKQAEEALADSELRYRTLAEAAFEGIALSQGGRLLDVNQRLADLVDYPRNELIGKPVLELVAPEHRELVKERIQAGATDTYEHLLLRRDGTKRPVEIRARGAQVAGRQVRVTAIRDITERKRAEEELRLAHERLQATFASLRSAVFVLEESAARIIDCNQAATRIFGYDRAEMLGRTTAFLHVSEGALTEFREQLRTAIERDGRLDGLEFRMRRKDGTVFETEHAVWELRSAQGARLGWVSVVRDTSEKVRMRAELEQTGKLLVQAQKMEAIGRLAGGIAHDFNNLLMVILSYSEMALLEVGEDGRAAEALIGIQSVVKQAKSLTQQILAYSRRQVLAMTNLDPNAQIAAAGKMLRRVIGEDIKIETCLALDPGRIRGDSSQLQQVLLNLAINARDAMPAGGTLTLATARITLGDEAAQSLPGARPGRYVVFRVSDTGTGMDEATLGKLFEPFFTTKELGRGTGLGLATVYGIVKQHGGYIQVESAPGVGSTFTIYLPPVEDATDAALDDHRGPSACGGNETILLVEDHELVREVTSRQLIASGYQVLAAADPLAALALARGHEGRIDLLLTDVVMPGMNGRELCSRLTTERPGLKVLFMSGHAGDALSGSDGSLADGLHFIQKPVGLADLTRRIRQILFADQRPELEVR